MNGSTGNFDAAIAGYSISNAALQSVRTEPMSIHGGGAPLVRSTGNQSTGNIIGHCAIVMIYRNQIMAEEPKSYIKSSMSCINMPSCLPPAKSLKK
jgi:hypothetical protein